MRNIRIAQIIDIFEAYGSSVNINLSFSDEVLNEKMLNNYIPTEPSVKALGEIVKGLFPDSPNRVRLITGQYGTGKSHFGLVLANFFQKEHGSNFLAEFVERLRRKDSSVAQLVLRNRASVSKPFLTVVLRPTAQPFEVALLAALRSSLDEAGIDFELKTNFQEAVALIERWEGDHDMEEHLEQELERRNTSIELLKAGLKHYKSKTYSDFCEVFEALIKLPFIPEHYASAGPVYEEVARLLKNNGKHEGIFVVVDEFGKYLTEIAGSPDSEESRAVQDFAEQCLASRENQVHFVAIAHRTLADYARGKRAREEWRKVSGRFIEHNLDFAGQYHEVVDIINAVVAAQRESDSQKATWKEIEKHFGNLRDWIKNHKLFTDQEDQWIYGQLLAGCYPLHPATVFCLPWLAQRLAQVNRTTFKFLAMDGEGGLIDFAASNRILTENGALNLYTPDKLLGYFSPAASEREEFRSILRAREEALGYCGNEPTAIRIVDLITVLEIISRPELQRRLKVITSILAPSSKDENEIGEVLDALVLQGIIRYREATESYELPRRGSGEVGAREGIDTVKNELRDEFDLLKGLKRVADLTPVVARRYERNHAVARQATRDFVTVDYLNNLEPYKSEIDTWYEPSQGTYKGDAKILYVLTTRAEEIALAKELLRSGTGTDQLLVAVPKQPFSNAEDVLELATITHIRNELGFKVVEGTVDGEDLRRIEEDKEEIVRDAIDAYLNAANFLWHFEENMRSSIRKGGEEGLVSEIMEACFNKTPAIRDESLTGITRDTQRKQRLSAMRGVLEIDGPIRVEKIRGGADQRMLRFALRDTEVLRKIRDVGSAEEFEVNRGLPANSSLVQIWNFLDDQLISPDPQSVHMGPIIRRLLYRPYGLSRPLIELLLAAYLRGIKDQCVVFKSTGPGVGHTQSVEQVELTAELVREIVKSPDQYVVCYYELAPEQQQYLRKLIKAIAEEDSELTGALLEKGRDALLGWYAQLPTGTKEARDLSARGQAVTELLSDTEKTEDTRHFLLEGLPGALDMAVEKWTATKSTALLKVIIEVKDELDNYIQRRATLAVDHLCELFAASGRTYEDLVLAASQWYSSLSEAHRLNQFPGEAGALIKCVRSGEGSVVKRYLEQLPKDLERQPYTAWTDDSEVDAFHSVVKLAKREIESWSPPKTDGRKETRQDTPETRLATLKSHISELLDNSGLTLNDQIKLLKDLLDEKNE